MCENLLFRLQSMARVVFVCALAQGLMTVISEAVADDEQTEQVRSAWELRRKRIVSLEYEFTVTDTHVFRGGRYLSEDPFAQSPQLNDSSSGTPRTTLETRVHSMKYSMAGGRFAYRKEGENWDPGSPQSRTKRSYTAIFDGNTNKYLNKGGPAPTGGIRRNCRQPHDRLASNSNLIPLSLLYFPADLIRRVGYDPQRMKVVQSHKVRGEYDCTELLIPAVTKHPNLVSPWRARVYVDATREYLPRGLVLENAGNVRRDISIEYIANEKVGWLVSHWSYNQFNSSGDVVMSSSGRVTRSSVNEPIEDSAFELTFPAGTHVEELMGDDVRKFIVLPNGTWRSRFGTRKSAP